MHRLDGRGVEDGDALVVATSGTTGAARCRAHPRRGAGVGAGDIGAARVSTDDTWLACLPLSHVGGLSVVDPGARRPDTRLIVHDGFDAEAVAQRRGEARRSCRSCRPRCGASTRRCSDAIVLGGSRPPDDLPDNVVTTYGMTETGSGVVYDGRAARRCRGSHRCATARSTFGARCCCAATATAPIPFVDGWFATGDLGESAPTAR